jgi:hypothetical protein
MTAGTKSFQLRSVPLVGEFTIKQETLGTDIMTIKGATSQTGDFIVLTNVDGTEKLAIESSGDIVLQQVDQTTFAKLQLPILNTAPASASLTKGDLWFSKGTTDVYRLSMCISTAAGTVKYGPRFIRNTIGTASS